MVARDARRVAFLPRTTAFVAIVAVALAHVVFIFVVVVVGRSMSVAARTSDVYASRSGGALPSSIELVTSPFVWSVVWFKNDYVGDRRVRPEGVRILNERFLRDTICI